VGAGSAHYGKNQGNRYQCAWTGPDGAGRPANVRLEILTLRDGAEVDRYVDLLKQRPGNVTRLSKSQIVHVARDPSASSNGVVFVADAVYRSQLGVVHLLLELTDPSLVRSFDESMVARVLTNSM
jgi:hypothetical protein